MEVKLEKIAEKGKNNLGYLFDEYVSEFEQKYWRISNELFDDFYREREGPPYICLDKYFDNENKENTAFFIKVDNLYAGFILVDTNLQILKKANGTYNLADMFLQKVFRRNGIGKKALIQLFNIHPGKWEIRSLLKSRTAEWFFKNVLSEYTQNLKKTTFGKFKKPVFLVNADEEDIIKYWWVIGNCGGNKWLLSTSSCSDSTNKKKKRVNTEYKTAILDNIKIKTGDSLSEVPAPLENASPMDLEYAGITANKKDGFTITPDSELGEFLVGKLEETLRKMGVLDQFIEKLESEQRKKEKEEN